MRKYDLKINDTDFNIQVQSFSKEEAELLINGKSYTIKVSGIEEDTMKSIVAKKPVPTGGAAPAPKPAAPAAPAAAAGGNSITAPIPGKIMEVFVKEGQEITVGQPVVKMEAMKMENVINATAAGTVGKILVNDGDSVGQGQELMILG